MVFVAIYHSRLTRFLAALIITLVVSPFSEPFATLDGTDFSGAGAVDVNASKLKLDTQDVLVLAQVGVFLSDAFTIAAQPFLFSVTLETRRSQRAILRV
jgi:hypothetical protein